MRRFVGKCLSQLWATSVSQEFLEYIGRFLNQSMEQVRKEISLEFWLRDSEASLCVWRVWITHSPSVPGFILTFCSLSILQYGESLSLPHESLFVVFSCVTWAWSDGQRDSLSPPTACAFLCLSVRWAHQRTAVKLSQGLVMVYSPESAAGYFWAFNLVCLKTKLPYLSNSLTSLWVFGCE